VLFHGLGVDRDYPVCGDVFGDGVPFETKRFREHQSFGLFLQICVWSLKPSVFAVCFADVWHFSHQNESHFLQ
jgi:hypothetical protein